MAIAAGRRLADRLYGELPDAKADYAFVPSVIFSHPPIATVGLAEEDAIKEYGKEDIKVQQILSPKPLWLLYRRTSCNSLETRGLSQSRKLSLLLSSSLHLFLRLLHFATGAL